MLEYSVSRLADMSASAEASFASSESSVRSSTRWISERHVATSSRRPSASRITFCAARWSDQKSGALASASSSSTLACLASRSKPPRGRVDPLSQIADLGRLHLASYLGAEREAIGLEQDRTELDDAQCSLAPGDDGVDTRTVSVVRADSAVAVAIERHGITAITTLALTRDQIHERIVK